MSVRAKKYLGQHFLRNNSVSQKIVNALSWTNYDRVLEIGPGMGALTKFLVEAKQNISVVEIDTESVAFLENEFPGLKIYSEDFLKMDLKEKLGDESIAVIGNFPYNISTQIVFKILENRTQIPEMVGMFQKEVAERICSKEGSKVYGILSVLTQAFYKTEYLFTVSENDFSPPPKVKSGVIRLTRFRDKLEIDEKLFFNIVKTAFGQRRKTLRNSLKSLGLPETGIDGNLLNLRAEQLNVAQYLELTAGLENENRN